MTTATKRDRGIAYLLERIDPELWEAVKAKAEREGHTVRWVLLMLLAEWVKR
jgi:hypothetical protein